MQIKWLLPIDRLIDYVNGKICFYWKDYRHKLRQKVMSLDDDEFIRRFLLHVLPSGGFLRIRHYGFLANRNRSVMLALCRQLLADPRSSRQTSRCLVRLSRPLRTTHRQIAA
jgi:hypothetical protein